MLNGLGRVDDAKVGIGGAEGCGRDDSEGLSSGFKGEI